MAYPTGSFPILTVLLKRLFVYFGWGVRSGYSCSSYLSSIIFASSSPLRVPRPAILIVSSRFWVKNRYYHGAWVTCGQYDRHAYETSVPADLSGPSSESLLIFPFCAFSSKNRLIPPKNPRLTPPPPTRPIPTLNALISAWGTYLIFWVERPGRELEEGRC